MMCVVPLYAKTNTLLSCLYPTIHGTGKGRDNTKNTHSHRSIKMTDLESRVLWGLVAIELYRIIKPLVAVAIEILKNAKKKANEDT